MIMYYMVLCFMCIVTFSSKHTDAVCSKGIIENGASKSANEIVKVHNDFRIRLANGKVPGQPRAINLKRLVWDNNLAAAAQRIADSCVFDHQKVTDPRFSVGQNLFMSWSSSQAKGSNWNSAVTSWYNEYKKYKYPGGFSMATGHYTQLMWADTKYVGCGYTFYPEQSKDKQFNKLYVCNYGPAGNFNNQAPYKTGNSGCENLC